MAKEDLFKLILCTIQKIRTYMLGLNLNSFLQKSVTSPFIQAYDKLHSGRVPFYIEKVNKSLYRGAGVMPENYPLLAALGIKKVINLQTLSAKDVFVLREAGEKNGIKFVNPPLNPLDLKNSVPPIIDELNDPAVKLVHCLLGRHRTGFVTALGRYIQEKIPMKEAIKDMHNHGFSTFHSIFIHGMESYLKKYARQHPHLKKQ